MMLHNQAKHRLILFLGVVTLILTGCLGTGGSSATKYYIIDPVGSGLFEEESASTLSIEIIDLNVPQYLERFHIATRRDQNRLHFSESHQWGENLRKNLLRTLARNLATSLATTDIGTPLNRSSSEPDYRLQIHIDQFEQLSNGTVILAARWQVNTGEDFPHPVMQTELQSSYTVDRGDYAAMVAAMQELFGEFSNKVASSVLALERGEG